MIISVPILSWNGIDAHALSLDGALEVIDTGGGDGDELRTAASASFMHAQRVIERLRTLARRSDQVGVDARILLDKLRESTR